MAHGKAAARDLVWGRQGGRWADGERSEVALEQIHKARLEGLAAGTWPHWCDEEWRGIAEQAKVLPPHALHPVDKRAVEVVARIGAGDRFGS